MKRLISFNTSGGVEESEIHGVRSATFICRAAAVLCQHTLSRHAGDIQLSPIIVVVIVFNMTINTHNNQYKKACLALPEKVTWNPELVFNDITNISLGLLHSESM